MYSNFGMAPQASEYVALFRDHLRLCNVRPGEQVLVVTDTEFNPAYAAGFLAAATDLGAVAVGMTLPSTMQDLNSSLILEAWKAADFVVCMVGNQLEWTYSDVHDEARRVGTRTLAVYEPIDVLRRLPASTEVRNRGAIGAAALGNAKTIRFVSEAGSDLLIPIEGRPPFYGWGVSDKPGMWDNWPQGQVAVFNAAGMGSGTLVVSPGDVHLPWIGTIAGHAAETTRFHIDDGVILDIEGNSEAILLRQWFAGWNDDRAYELCHAGWGTEHRADWLNIGQDSEALYGSITIGMGRNTLSPWGGLNDGPAHWDSCLLNHSVYLDDVMIMDSGTPLESVVEGLAKAASLVE